jgi:trans-aconitate methyltransferase
LWKRQDAVEIFKYTDNYLGIDISKNLIELAQQKIPKGDFKIADIENYDFPKNIDVIFAFASLIHVPKDSLKEILGKAYSSLNDGGIIRLS